MTKAAKARRQRLERLAGERAREFKSAAQTGGVQIQSMVLTELTHERLEVANKLGFSLVLRPDYASSNPVRAWRVLAVKG